MTGGNVVWKTSPTLVTSVSKPPVGVEGMYRTLEPRRTNAMYAIM